MNKAYEMTLFYVAMVTFFIFSPRFSRAENATSNAFVDIAWSQAQKYAKEALLGGGTTAASSSEKKQNFWTALFGQPEKVSDGTQAYGQKTAEDLLALLKGPQEESEQGVQVKSLGDYLNAAFVNALESGNVEEAEKIATVPAQLPEHKKEERSYLYQMLIPVVIYGIKMAVKNLNWRTIQKTAQWFNSMRDQATREDAKEVEDLLQSAQVKAQKHDPKAVDMLQTLIQGMQ